MAGKPAAKTTSKPAVKKTPQERSQIVSWTMNFGMTRRLEAGMGAGEFFRFDVGAEASVGKEDPKEVISKLQDEILMAALEFQKKLGLK